MADVELIVTMDDPGTLDGVVGFDTWLAGAAAGDADPALAAIAPAPLDLCTIGYTSGTTGHPKGAMQSHRAVRLNCGLTATMHCRTADDVVVTALPAPHVYGNVVINGTFLAGGKVVLLDRFDPGLALRTIAEHQATLFEGVPAMYAMALADPALGDVDLSSLRCCTVGGQTMPVATMEAWEKASGAPLLELWGMTEIAGLGTTHPLHCPNRLGSIGVALAGVEVAIGDLTDPARRCGPGEPGELLVRGPITMLGYFGNAAATAGGAQRRRLAAHGRRRGHRRRRLRDDRRSPEGHDPDRRLQRLPGRDRAGARLPPGGRHLGGRAGRRSGPR